MSTPSAQDQPRDPSAVLSGEEFARLFGESFRVLWLIGMGVTGDRHLAEDVVQDAAMLALKKLDDFEPGTNFNAWMGKIVRYVAMNRRRKESRRDAISLDAAGTGPLPAGNGNDPPSEPIGRRGELPVDQQMFDDQLTDELRSLGEMARACLLLRVVGGLDYAEISQTLEIPAGTAMSHVHRTRKLLRERLEPTHSRETADG